MRYGLCFGHAAHHSHIDKLKDYQCTGSTLSKVMGSILSFSFLKRVDALILLSAINSFYH